MLQSEEVMGVSEAWRIRLRQAPHRFGKFIDFFDAFLQLVLGDVSADQMGVPREILPDYYGPTSQKSYVCRRSSVFVVSTSTLLK